MGLSIRAYARHRADQGLPGRTHTAVRKAIATGRLSASVRKDVSGSVEIDAELADAEWEQNTDAMKADRAPREPGPAAAAPPGQGALFVDGTEASSSPARAAVARDPQSAAALSKANAVLKTYQARMAELEFRARAGELVRAADVQKAYRRHARRVRDALLAMPDRLAAELTAEVEERKIRERLLSELERILTDLVESPHVEGAR